MKNNFTHIFSVAPMLHKTDRHCRYFYRLLSKKALLYTEMITTKEIIYGKTKRLIYNEEEHPLAIQLAGNNPSELAICAKIAKKQLYDEINLNIGCPSKRVQNGYFGISLMQEGKLVADCINAISDVVDIPITIKTRIGFDNNDSYDFLTDFINKVITNSSCRSFIIHARKALLLNLNPKQNRLIPPLNYSRVYQLKKDFPDLTIILNGGIKTIEESKIHLKYIDGVMLGREIYNNPLLLTKVDSQLFNQNMNNFNLLTLIEKMFPYIEKQLKHGVYLGYIICPILKVFHGINGIKKINKFLNKHGYKKSTDINIFKKALNFIINPDELNY